jgi:non-specific serine/threonine protein kinase
LLAYESGVWEINLARRELRLRGQPVPLGGRAFSIVEVLVQSAGELVTKDDLMSRVWPDVIVGDNTLQVHVSALRKAFGGDRWTLKTTAGRGYRLLGEWRGRQ